MQTEVVAMTFFLMAWLLQIPAPALENDYVRVMRDAAPCASANMPGCADRVIVALGDIELRSGKSRRKMTRGDIAVFKPGESYEPPTGGPFFEVNIKPNHPPVQSPPEIIPPEKNAIRYDGKTFFIFEERLAVGDTSETQPQPARRDAAQPDPPSAVARRTAGDLCGHRA